MNFRTAYSPSLGKEYGLKCPPEESMTKQADYPSTDINLIMARYAKTGLLPEAIARDPRYGDFSEVPDYLDALQIVANAQDQFALLDAAVRKRFDNDPAQFLDFVNDDANREEAVKLGLIPAPVVTPSETPAIPPEAFKAVSKGSKKAAKDAGGGDSGEA